ncbi:SPOSA6832_01928 [Sporobolomyces salmonicolor]|uniref:SPOSA6832_01928-mRNA-1:cds n=1 Tax=Sporidiobolus salmonicolor TaxID=5005 RepID=A0A0D6EKP2_SPOSA|nr:SPOSA6832_01928 [Sporobolomyces salmonicolor]
MVCTIPVFHWGTASLTRLFARAALVNYRSAFRLDPDVDKAWHIASRAAQAHASSRGAAPHSLSSSNTDEWRFERTVQLGPDYEASKEHRPKEVAERETGKGDQDQTHPSSTSFLLSSLLKSIAENPYERPPPSVNAAAHSPTSNENAPAPVTDASPKPSTQAISPEEALASLTFIPADEELPLPLANLPREVLLLILRHLLLSSMLPPPRPAHVEEPTVFGKGKRALKKRTLKEEMLLVEEDLELENVEREWKSDVEALERFARQIKREESAQELVKLHGNDWRRFYIEHPRIRLDGVYISVVTYLRRGEVQSVYAPTHLITFYRYIRSLYRFYHHGLVVSLLTTDPPANVVRRLNPSLQMQGLTLGRWRLRGDLVELWGLEDPNVDESRRKYSFRMGCRLKSSARGRMNKLEMLSLATEHRETLELEDVPIRPTKPFYFSKVQSYSGEDLL